MSSAVLEFWDFSIKIISHLSFLLCLINNRVWANHFNEVYITERCVWSMLQRITKNKQGFHVKGGEFNLASMWSWEVLFLMFREIFSASQMSPQWTEESDWFCYANKWEILRRYWCSCYHCRLCVCQYASVFVFVLYVCVHACPPVNVCVIELCHERISRSLSSPMLMLAWRQTWGLTEEPITIILEKWSKVSFSSPPNQGEVVYHFGMMFGCLPCMSALGP